MADRTVLPGMKIMFNSSNYLSICTLMLCPLIVHVYSCCPENEAPAVFLYSAMLVGSDDCEQVNGPDPALVCCQDQSTVLLRLLLSHQPVHSGVGYQQSEQSRVRNSLVPGQIFATQKRNPFNMNRAKYISDSSTFVYRAVALLLHILLS